ncbi:hypothetical protein V8J88_22815 [Massilia sp. W12]|uniref:hypothetical protein n=1 Tax=Massilia sp. W12 TaxID=3126507 RepID=UPI0030CFC4AC
MQSLFCRFLLPGLLALAATPISATGIEGQYRLKGVDPDGKNYQARITIARQGQAWRLVYNDGKPVSGVGIVRGPHLFAAWGPGETCILSALEVLPSGELSGAWGYMDSTNFGQENWKRTAGPGLPGNYSAMGRAPDGLSYTGQGSIEARGNLFKTFFRDNSNDTFDGVGLRHGNFLAIAWGGEKCSVSAYNLRPDGGMSGVFAEYGHQTFGREEITPGW